MARARRKSPESSVDDGRDRELASVKGEAAAEPLKLERLIHGRMRLAIVSALAVNDTLTFTELRSMLAATDGNLSVHARKLEDAGYVQCRKSFQDRTPRTEYRLTAEGRRALDRYLEHMGAVIRHTRSS